MTCIDDVGSAAMSIVNEWTRTTDNVNTLKVSTWHLQSYGCYFYKPDDAISDTRPRCSPPQKIVILRHAIFPQFWPCWWSAQFFPYSAIFAQLLLNCPLDGRDRPVTANATTAFCFSLSKWLKYCEWAWRTALIMLHVTGTVVGLPCSRMTSLTTLKAVWLLH